MTSDLRKPMVERYNNADHIEFHETTYRIFFRNATVIDAPTLIPIYLEKVRQEDTIYKWLRKSEFTAKKVEADRIRDNAYEAIVSIIHNDTKDSDPTIRDHAKHLANLVDNYGNVSLMDYDGATAAIDNVVERLVSDDYKPSLQALEILQRVLKLDSLNTDFKMLVEKAEKEQVDKPNLSPKAARRETDAAMRAITTRIGSNIDLKGITTFTKLIKEFNTHVDHYNTLVQEHYGRMHVRTDITGAVIADIEAQAYTGNPVVVLPSVKLLKTEKDGTTTLIDLFFAQDFTLGYRDNINPGMATVIVSGIGEYVGDVSTTFKIVAIG
jgi:hypothetical protein